MVKTHIYFALLVALLLSACSKKPEAGISVVAFRVPRLSDFGTQKYGTLSTIPTDRSACFGVNVVAIDITTTPASTCNPRLGKTAGFIAEGGLLQVDVLRGEARTFELYMYLKPVGDTKPCPAYGASFSAAQLKQVYFMGSTTQSILREVENVNIVANFPGLNQTLAVANSYPASCTASAVATLNPNFHVSNSTGIAVGGGMRLSSTVGKTGGPVMTGGGMKLVTK